MEAPSSSTVLDNEDMALKSLLDRFGSVFSLEDVASAFCKAKGDVNVAGELLYGMRRTSSDEESNGFVKSKSCSKFSDDHAFGKPCYENGNGDCKESRLKTLPASMGTVSSVLGNSYVWRARTNVTRNGTKPLEVEGSKFSGSDYSSGESLSGRDTDANMNTDLENFLFEMLGQGFQIEKSVIHQVLGQCGYDMKKSLETLLDLAAVTLDGRNDFLNGSNLKSNSETPASQNQVQKQKIAESRSTTMRTNGILPRQTKERDEQQKEVMTALFRVPERPDFTASAPVSRPARRARTFGTVVTEPLKNIDEDHEAKSRSPHLVNLKDEAEEDSYEILRKAVREYRGAMKEYYKAAAEAFTSDDRARASILMEKGRFFYNKSREADEESAEKIFETSSGDRETKDEMCLDLQNHDAKEAIRLVKCHLRTLSGIPSINDLKIILGTEEQGAEKRRRMIIKLLERDSIKWIEDKDLGTMLIRLDEINPKHLSFAQKA